VIRQRFKMRAQDPRGWAAEGKFSALFLLSGPAGRGLSCLLNVADAKLLMPASGQYDLTKIGLGLRGPAG